MDDTVRALMADAIADEAQRPALMGMIADRLDDIHDDSEAAIGLRWAAENGKWPSTREGAVIVLDWYGSVSFRLKNQLPYKIYPRVTPNRARIGTPSNNEHYHAWCVFRETTEECYLAMFVGLGRGLIQSGIASEPAHG